MKPYPSRCETLALAAIMVFQATECQTKLPHVAGFHNSAGGEEIEARILVSDPTLAGLPVVIAAWGSERVSVGVSVTIPDPRPSNPQPHRPT